MRIEILSGKTALSFQVLEHGFCVLKLSDGYDLTFECLGRFVGNGSVFISTADHGHQFGLPTPYDAAGDIEGRIKGKVIERVVLREDTNDLSLHFSSGVLEFVCSSAGYEAYQLRGPENLIVVGRGGRAEPNKTPDPTRLARPESGRSTSI